MFFNFYKDRMSFRMFLFSYRLFSVHVLHTVCSTFLLFTRFRQHKYPLRYLLMLFLIFVCSLITRYISPGFPVPSFPSMISRDLNVFFLLKLGSTEQSLAKLFLFMVCIKKHKTSYNFYGHMYLHFCVLKIFIT